MLDTNCTLSLPKLPKAIKPYDMTLFKDKTSMPKPLNDVYCARFEVAEFVKEQGDKICVHFAFDLRVCSSSNSRFCGLSDF